MVGLFSGQDADVLAHSFHLTARCIQHPPDGLVLLLFSGHLPFDLLKFEPDHPDHLS